MGLNLNTCFFNFYFDVLLETKLHKLYTDGNKVTIVCVIRRTIKTIQKKNYLNIILKSYSQRSGNAGNAIRV